MFKRCHAIAASIRCLAQDSCCQESCCFEETNFKLTIQTLHRKLTRIRQHLLGDRMLRTASCLRSLKPKESSPYPHSQPSRTLTLHPLNNRTWTGAQCATMLTEQPGARLYGSVRFQAEVSMSVCRAHLRKHQYVSWPHDEVYRLQEARPGEPVVIRVIQIHSTPVKSTSTPVNLMRSLQTVSQRYINSFRFAANMASQALGLHKIDASFARRAASLTSVSQVPGKWLR